MTSFQEAVAARLHAGAIEYRGSGYLRPLSELIAEVMEEACDISGWSVISGRVLADTEIDRDEREAVSAALEHASDIASTAWYRLAHALEIVTAAERARLEAEHRTAA